MVKKLVSVVVLAALMASCGGGKKKDEIVIREGKGGVNLGGIFKVNEVEQQLLPAVS